MENNQENQVNNNISKESENSNIEIIEFSNDTSESKGILSDNTSTTESQNDFSDKTINAVNKLINTTDYSNYYGSEEVKQYKIYAVLCYIPLVVLYFKYFAKLNNKSKYMAFHINQGINITLLWIFTFIVSKILYVLFTKKYLMSEETPGWVSFISYILYCISIVLSLVGMYRTYKSKSQNLPIIGKYKFIK